MSVSGRSPCATRPVGDAAQTAGTVRHARWRQRWLALHLWLGLSLGALLVVLGLTGSLLVFYTQIDGWLNPAVVVPRRDAPEHSLQAIFTAIRHAEAARDRGWRIELPRGNDRAYHARYYFAAEKAGRGFAPLLVTVDPYTLQIRARRFWGESAMTWIYDLHYTLLLGSAGHYLLGIAGLLMLVSLGSGLYLWWPRGTRWRQALTAKRHAGPKRLNYDVHKLSGIHGLALLLVVIGTGVCLELPGWVEPLVTRLSPLQPMPDPRVGSSRVAQYITLDAAAAIARQHLPQAAVRWIETPDGAGGVYRVRLYQPGEPSQRFPRSFVWIDPRDGRVLAVRDARERRAGDALLAWLHPLHAGEAFGLPGRWLVLLSGLLPAALFTTGAIRWRQKRRARRIVQGWRRRA